VFATAEMGAAINASMSVVAVFLAIFMNCLELMVAFLQAFVFTMLTSVFIGFAQMEGEHAEHTEHTEK
jgi:F-type H+-transporting ATPase subunit a